MVPVSVGVEVKYRDMMLALRSRTPTIMLARSSTAAAYSLIRGATTIVWIRAASLSRAAMSAAVASSTRSRS